MKSSKNEDENETFFRHTKAEKFITVKLTPQEVLNKIFQAERKMTADRNMDQLKRMKSTRNSKYVSK